MYVSLMIPEKVEFADKEWVSECAYEVGQDE